MKQIIIKLILVVCLLLIQGCVSGSSNMPNATHYYLNPTKPLSQIGRVAIVELDNYSNYPEVSTDMTNSLYRSLQKTQLFGLTVILKENNLWRDLQINANDKYTLKQLSAIKKAIHCNAILTGTVTQYSPYPHTLVAINLRLTDLRDGNLVWAIEQIFDSSDKTTEAKIKNYLRGQNNKKTNSLDERLITISPVKFMDFVNYEVASTMLAKK